MDTSITINYGLLKCKRCEKVVYERYSNWCLKCIGDFCKEFDEMKLILNKKELAKWLKENQKTKYD